jgi:hypothetical protein
MPTDHQVSEGYPHRSERKLGMIITATIVVVLFVAAIWGMMR